MRERQGFTLIELLVVIAIIGLLATMAVVSFSGARVKARDAKRISDMKQIYNAIELYNDENGHYPIVATWASFDAPSYMGTAVTSPAAANLTAALQPWLGTNIGDPKRTSSPSSGYLYYSNGTNWCILLYLTPENLNNYPDSYVSPKRCGGVDANGVCNVAGWQWGPSQAVFIGSSIYTSGPNIGC